MIAGLTSVTRDLPRQPSSSADEWYAIVDAAQDATFLFLPADAMLERESLYAGELGAMLDDVAPHLVRFRQGSAFANWFRDRLGAHCGILLRSRASFSEIRKHLRGFLLVKNEVGKQFRFRFYDPRVLRTFLPACSADEAKRFFGPIGQFYTPLGDTQSFTAFTRGNASVRTASLTFQDV
jgi:hypothetical protein